MGEPGEGRDLAEDLGEELLVAVLEDYLLDGVLAAVQLVPGPVDSAEAALGEEGDLLELCAVTGVVVEGALGGRTQVGQTLGQVGTIDLTKTDVTL